MNIYIIGFMGTGKSAVGGELARMLGRRFIDLDAYIESKAGKKIKEIFKQAGEGFFRQIERKVLAEVAMLKESVIACGGGITLDPANVEVMKRTGRLICLSASVDEIAERVSLSKDRPLLEGGNPRERIEKLLEQRKGLYACADAGIDTTGLTPEEAARLAARLLLTDEKE